MWGKSGSGEERFGKRHAVGCRSGSSADSGGRRRDTPVEIDPNRLPKDPAALRQVVVGLLEEAELRERRLRQLQHWVEQLLRWRYGPRRERVNENQLFLFAVGLVSAWSRAAIRPGLTGRR